MLLCLVVYDPLSYEKLKANHNIDLLIINTKGVVYDPLSYEKLKANHNTDGLQVGKTVLFMTP